MPEFPAAQQHPSTYLSPQPLPPKHSIAGRNNDPSTSAAPLNIEEDSSTVRNPDNASQISSQISTPALPDSIVSPAFTPPSTPGGFFPQVVGSRTAGKSTAKKALKLLPRLPNVECIVRARIPTTTGAEMFLHLYQNDLDNKEHLAIVFGNKIRSRSLDRERPGETEMDRMIRGAYVGRLRPGRNSSRYDDEESREKSKAEDRPVSDTEATAAKATAPLVRIHSECYTGETAWSARCDCGEQLDEAARLMAEAAADGSACPGGVIIYLRQEGRGIGLGEKLKAYNLQDLGLDTVEANLLLRHPADARSYGLATAMLVDLGMGVDTCPDAGIRLLTNNPDKIWAVEGPNREVVVKERVPMIPIAWRTGGEKGIRSSEIEEYLKTKVSMARLCPTLFYCCGWVSDCCMRSRLVKWATCLSSPCHTERGSTRYVYKGNVRT